MGNIFSKIGDIAQAPFDALIGRPIEAVVSGVGQALRTVTGAEQAAKAAERAAETQQAYGSEAIQEQRRQFDRLISLLSPYEQMGAPAAVRQAIYERALVEPSFAALRDVLIPQAAGQAGALQTLAGVAPGAATALQQTIAQQRAGELGQVAGAVPGALEEARRIAQAGGAQQAQLQQLAGFAPGALAQQAQFAQAGVEALQQQRALSGAAGPQAQQQAIAAIEQSPEFQAAVQQGESAILQNASATGGLRGGNVQAALAQYRPQLLNQFIQQKYQQLGGLAQSGLETARGITALGAGLGETISGRGAQAAQNLLGLGTQTAESLTGRGAQAAQNLLGLGAGVSQQLFGTGAQAAQNAAQMGQGIGETLLRLAQSSAAGQAGAGMQSAQQIGSLLGDIGAARAGGQLAAGARQSQLFGDLLKLGGAAYGAGLSI